MTYVLRKLIAFVFLGGMFWFIYQDLDNLDKPWFMHALGLITVAFAFFWLLIPMVVVQCRIAARRRQNKERHAKWLADGGFAGIRPQLVKGSAQSRGIAAIASDDKIYFHEKGTLYAEFEVAGLDPSLGASRPVGRPSDVAFPGFKRKCRVSQRTHCYFTERRVAFVGKDLDFCVPFAEIKSFSVMPGGIVFVMKRGESAVRLAFTFQNPLIAAEVLRHLREVS